MKTMIFMKKIKTRNKISSSNYIFFHHKNANQKNLYIRWVPFRALERSVMKANIPFRSNFHKEHASYIYGCLCTQKSTFENGMEILLLLSQHQKELERLNDVEFYVWKLLLSKNVMVKKNIEFFF